MTDSINSSFVFEPDSSVTYHRVSSTLKLVNVFSLDLMYRLELIIIIACFNKLKDNIMMKFACEEYN